MDIEKTIKIQSDLNAALALLKKIQFDGMKGEIPYALTSCKLDFMMAAEEVAKDLDSIVCEFKEK